MRKRVYGWRSSKTPTDLSSRTNGWRSSKTPTDLSSRTNECKIRQHPKTEISGKQPLISLLTDFGRDESAYLIKSAIDYVNPNARVTDITHSVPPFNILSGAWRLSRVVTAKTEREGTIYVAVVDPGVGGGRECIIVRTKTGKYLVGPDNGLLSLAFQAEGIDTAVSIDNSELTLLSLADSVTFHGKDVFGPAAAHLAAGVHISEFGERLEESTLKEIALDSRSDATSRTGALVDIDDFGTLRTNLPNHLHESILGKQVDLFILNRDPSLLGARFRWGDNIISQGKVFVRDTFEGSAKDETIAVLSSTGCLDIAVNLGSAAKKLGSTHDHIILDESLRPATWVHLDFNGREAIPIGV